MSYIMVIFSSKNVDGSEIEKFIHCAQMLLHIVFVFSQWAYSKFLESVLYSDNLDLKVSSDHRGISLANVYDWTIFKYSQIRPDPQDN